MTQAEHLNIFVASGDCGAYASANFSSLRSNQPDVQFPASDPSVVGVGGTTLSVDSQGTRNDETVWSGNPQNPPDCKNQWGISRAEADWVLALLYHYLDNSLISCSS